MREHKQCKQITEFTDFLQKGATTISTCSCTAVQNNRYSRNGIGGKKANTRKCIQPQQNEPTVGQTRAGPPQSQGSLFLREET